MTRKEEIIQAARQKEKEVGFTQIVKDSKGVNSAYGIGFLEGAEWADEHPNNLWKDAQGEDLPKIDRDVIALVEAYGGYKVVFAHRPKHFCGEKDVDYNQPIIYDNGGWNMPDVVYWLDLDLPIKE